MGALTGYKVIELAGIGPAPMGGMILADMGAEVIRIERPGAADPKVAEPISGRNKKSVVLDLKQDAGRKALMTPLSAPMPSAQGAPRLSAFWRGR